MTDTNIKKIRPADYELSTVQDNLASAIQSVMEQVQSASGAPPSQQAELQPLMQRVRGPGTPQTVQAPALRVHGDPAVTGVDVVTIGDPATGSKARVDAPVSIYGRTNVTGATTINGSAKVTPAASGAAFVVTNVAGDAQNFIVTDLGSITASGQLTVLSSIGATGNVSAPSFVSTAGFKSFIPMGVQTRTTAQAGVQRTTNSNNIVMSVPMPFAGSIVGISLALSNTVTADVTVQVFKNVISATAGQIIDTAGVKAGAYIPAAPITFPKGTYPFAANDFLGMGIYIGSGFAFTANCGLVVEFGA